MKSESEKALPSSFVEGALSVFAVLGGSRSVEKIFLSPGADKKSGKIAGIIRRANAAGIPVEDCSEEFYEEHSTSKTNGGVLALCSERKTVSCSELFDKGHPLAVLLCGIEDPYNFGYAVRSLYAAGAGGLVLPRRNWLSAAGVCVRASAGSSEMMDCAMYDSEAEAVASAKEHGYFVLCAEEKDSVDLFESGGIIGSAGKILLVIGGEKRGITSEILKSADLRVRIPYGNDFGCSLTASSAAAVLGFEILRMRKEAGKNLKTTEKK